MEAKRETADERGRAKRGYRCARRFGGRHRSSVSGRPGRMDPGRRDGGCGRRKGESGPRGGAVSRRCRRGITGIVFAVVFGLGTGVRLAFAAGDPALLAWGLNPFLAVILVYGVGCAVFASVLGGLVYGLRAGSIR